MKIDNKRKHQGQNSKVTFHYQVLYSTDQSPKVTPLKLEKRVCNIGFQLQPSDTNSEINKTKSMYVITITHQAIKFNIHLEKAKHCKYSFVPNEKKV